MGIGLGLGTSLWGFVSESISTYLQLDRVLEHLGRTFRLTGREAGTFGMALGYGRAETAAFVEQYGAHADRLGQGVGFRGALGFGNLIGNPGAALQFTGRAAGLQTRRTYDEEITAAVGAADQVLMGEGRLGEYLNQHVLPTMERQLSQMGDTSVRAAIGALRLAPDVFGQYDPRSRGSYALRFQEQINAGLTSQSNRAQMMMALGFGSANGADYW